MTISRAFMTQLNTFVNDKDGLTSDEAGALAEVASKAIAKTGRPTALGDEFMTVVRNALPTAEPLATSSLDVFDTVFQFSVFSAVETRKSKIIVNQLHSYFHKNAGKLPKELVDVKPSSITVTDDSSDADYVGFKYKDGARGMVGEPAAKKMQTLLTGALKLVSIGYSEPIPVPPYQAKLYADEVALTPAEDIKTIREPAHIQGAPYFAIGDGLDGFVLSNRIIVKVTAQGTGAVSWHDYGHIPEANASTRAREE